MSLKIKEQKNRNKNLIVHGTIALIKKINHTRDNFFNKIILIVVDKTKIHLFFLFCDEKST
jgi:hypothetical protein